MVTTQSPIDALNKLYDERKARCEKLRHQLAEAEKELEAFSITIKALGFSAPSSALGITLSGMTQLEALIAIAKANGGILSVRQARRQMEKAGLFKNPDNASSIIFTAIARSKKFERIGSGKYKLLAEGIKTVEPFPIPTAIPEGQLDYLTPTSHPRKA